MTDLTAAVETPRASRSLGRRLVGLPLRHRLALLATALALAALPVDDLEHAWRVATLHMTFGLAGLLPCVTLSAGALALFAAWSWMWAHVQRGPGVLAELPRLALQCTAPLGLVAHAHGEGGRAWPFAGVTGLSAVAEDTAFTAGALLIVTVLVRFSSPVAEAA